LLFFLWSGIDNTATADLVPVNGEWRAFLPTTALWQQGCVLWICRHGDINVP